MLRSLVCLKLVVTRFEPGRQFPVTCLVYDSHVSNQAEDHSQLNFMAVVNFTFLEPPDWSNNITLLMFIFFCASQLLTNQGTAITPLELP